jgi:hypothetical protein
VAAHRDLVLLRLPHLQQDYFICRLQSVLLAAAQTDPHVYGTSIGTCEEEREGVAEPVLDLLVHNKWDVMQNLQIHYREEELQDLLYWKTDTVIPLQQLLVLGQLRPRRNSLLRCVRRNAQASLPPAAHYQPSS